MIVNEGYRGDGKKIEVYRREYQHMIHILPPKEVESTNYMLNKDGKIEVWKSKIKTDMSFYDKLRNSKKIVVENLD